MYMYIYFIYSGIEPVVPIWYMVSSLLHSTICANHSILKVYYNYGRTLVSAFTYTIWHTMRNIEDKGSMLMKQLLLISCYGKGYWICTFNVYKLCIYTTPKLWTLICVVYQVCMHNQKIYYTHWHINMIVSFELDCVVMSLIQY